MKIALSTLPITTQKIAVIGMAVCYPGASSLRQFWENILTKRQQFREMLDCRLPLEEYWSADKDVPDKTYGRSAAYIDDFDFDWKSRRIPKSSVYASDIVHWLALDVALKALRDARYRQEQIRGSRTAVILGNTLTGEWTRSNSLRTRWPFVEKVLRKTARTRRLGSREFDDFLRDAETAFKSVFPAVDEDTLAGGLSNTVAGRICNYLDIHGGGYTVDGACSSSLLAVINGSNNLAWNEVDLVLAGGVDISLDNFELIGFAKTGALSSDKMRVYDQRASGFVPGEGCGFVVLKRLADALDDGDRIYAVIHGWGVSSDGKGGITAPSVEGQAMALRAAYSKAGYDASEIDFIEGHGTGTPLGDAVELRAICQAIQCDPGEHKIGVTSLKSVIGHTKAAAGIGAFIKAVIAVNRRILPPIAGTEVPRDVFSSEAKALFPLIDGVVRPEAEVLRVGTSAMGFGGINTHVICESFGQPARHLQPFIDERVLMAHPEDAELFLFGASSQNGLLRQLEAARGDARNIAMCELADLSASLAHRMAPNATVRAAFCADSPGTLLERLKALAEMINKGVREGDLVRDEPRGLWLGNGVHRTRVAYLFPGQGSQRINMARTLIRRFDWAAELVQKAKDAVDALGTTDFVDRLLGDNLEVLSEDALSTRQRALAATEVAQPAIILASLIWYRRLAKFGIAPVAVGGHSLGELMTLYAGGVCDEETLLHLAARRGYEMSPARGDERGMMAALLCGQETAEALIASVPGYVEIANINGPEQVAVSGENASIEAVLELATRRGVNTRILPVSNAFHSKFMAGAADRFAAAFPELDGLIEGRRLLSCIDGKPIQGRVKVGKHLSRQMLAQVDFISLANSLAQQADLVIEVGPGRILSDLFVSIVGKDRALALPVEPQTGGMLGFKQVLAAAHVLGHDLNWAALYENRLIRAFVPARSRVFIENPCEREIAIPPSPGCAGEIAGVSGDAMVPVPPPMGGTVRPAAPRHLHAPVPPPVPAVLSTLQRVTQFAAELTGFEVSTLSGDMKLLDDLNMDSIKTAELIAVLAREFRKQPDEEASKYANATLNDLCAWLDESRASTASDEEAAQPALAVAETSSALARVAAAASPPSVGSLEQRLLALVSQITEFEPETLDPEMKLLDDLNIDSIKAAELLTLIGKENGLSDGMQLSTYSNARISEIARAIAAAVGPTPAKVSAPAASAFGADVSAAAGIAGRAQPKLAAFPRRPSWVRSFVEGACREDLAALPAISGWSGRRVWVIRPDDDHLAAECAGLLAAHGADIVETSMPNLEDGAPPSAGDVLIFVPRGAVAVGRASLSHFFEECHRATLAALAVNGRGAKPRITFVQRDSRLPQRRDDDPVFSITAYVASVAQEWPDVRVRAIGCSSEPTRDLGLAKAIGQEVLADAAQVAVWLDDDCARWVPTYIVKEPCELRDRNIAWTADDVVLVTGGARGITAECTLAFARETGVRIAAVGLTPQTGPDATDDAVREIRSILDRYAAAGVLYRYYASDVTDAGAVAALTEQVQRELGPVTGLIHGAGLNQPSPITALTSAAAALEWAPKVLGIVNLLDSLDLSLLKMVVGFGSIIGVTGMRGNAVYGFSNEVMANLLAGLRRRLPNAHVVSIAYSVWDEVGMGARLGSVEKLSAQGIAAIPVAEGVRRFMELASADADTHQVIVAGRMGRNKAWNMAERALPNTAGETLIYHHPQVEAAYTRRLSLAKDTYLADHNFKGSFLFPTVFGLEAMARAVCTVLGIDWLGSHSITDISLARPVTAGQHYDTELEVYAEVLERKARGDPVRVRAGVRCDLSGFEQDHFAATFVLKDLGIGPLHEVEVRKPLPIAKTGTLYGDILFQGPAFQRINSVHRLENPEPGKGLCVFRSRHEPDGMLLGDPYFRDSLLQSVQIIIPQDVSLPVSIDRIDFYAGWNAGAGDRTCVAYLHERSGDFYQSSVVALDHDGRVVERLHGYRLKVLEQREKPRALRELALA